MRKPNPFTECIGITSGVCITRERVAVPANDL
jgi:hypothetical protein